MPEKESTSNTHNTSSNVDLNSLADLSFGPSWADDTNVRKSNRKDSHQNKKFGANIDSRNIKKDRRGQTKYFNSRSNSSSSKKKAFSENNQKSEFVPKFDIKIYPQDETFETLIKQLKGNFITYQLFEITRLILEKSDRFVCLINRVKKNEGEISEPIYFTPKDNLPFDTEEEAISHYCEHYLENFFDIETVEVEPPKGNFTLVYRCPFTKHLIGPPNFHRFLDLLKEHHSSKIKNLSIDDYQNKLESLSDEASINEWLETSSKEKHYHIKKEADNQESGAIFKTIEEAKRFLLKNHKESIVKSSPNFRFSGAKLDNLQKSNLKSSIYNAIEAQRRFPLDTANNIRGRLRRHKFTIYKKGSKGISYVCCVKRKFRDESTVFTDSISNLITFIEKNQNINIQNLPYKFLSIPNPATKNKSDDYKDGAEDDPIINNSESHKDEETSKITEVIRNVRWLISEGYVTEYSDGKLLIHPKAEANHIVKNEEQNTSKESSQSIDSAEPTIKNTNALKEKTTLASDYEASSPESCNVTEEPGSNNLEEKSI
tara:strand:- start:271 stop:1902 length:1632 start_codon:yes stop_codon:yes gene_type:complete